MTASPSHGIEATIELCEGLIARGHDGDATSRGAHVPRSGAPRGVLERCRRPGSESAFVVGGDAKDRGEIHDGLALLRLMEELGHPFTSVGVRRLSGGTPGDPGGATCSTALLGEAGARDARHDADELRRDAIASWIGTDPGRRRDAARAPRRSRCGEGPAAGPDRGADRRRRFAPVPGEEPAAAPAPRPQRRSPPTAAPLARSDARRSRGGRRGRSTSSRSTRWRRPSRGSERMLDELERLGRRARRSMK